MPRSRAERFVHAFHEIELYLRSRVGADRRLRFYDLVTEVAKGDQAVAAFELDLREFADLRNAIVHEGTGKPIASPYIDTVRAIEEIAAVIKSPPVLADVVVVERVATCTPETAVLAAARCMREGDFSQLPVLSGDSVVALLTAETITRYIASLSEAALGHLATAEVGEVLPHAERDDNYEVVVEATSTFEAIELFRRTANEGRSLDAVLVKGSVGLRTIVTPFDLPLLLAASRLS
jgi:predicted transcriptional regulator